MRRTISIPALATALALAAPAAAQAPGEPLRVDPPVAGKASHLLVDVRTADDPQSGGRTPQSLAMAFAAGAKFDPRARSERCSPERAEGFDCPANSQIGSGVATLTASNGPFSQQLTADLKVFLAPAVRSGDAAGVVLYFKERSTGQQGSATGRVVKTSGTFGIEVRFDDIGSEFEPPQGVTVRVDRVQADVGAFRYEKVKVCCKTVRKNGQKRRVRYTKKVRRDLLRNPRTCGGSWPYQVRLRYSATEESVRDGSVACTASRR